MIKMLTGSNCPACTMLKNRFEAIGLGHVYSQLDIESEEGTNLARAQGIRSIPVLVKFEGDSVVDTLTGASHTIPKYKEFLLD